MATAEQLATYLLSDACPTVVEAEPVLVTIKGKTYQAARYREELKYQPGMDCVTRGDKKAGDTYSKVNVYVFGQRPCFDRAKFCFKVPGDVHEWYISCHSRPRVEWNDPFVGSVPLRPPFDKEFFIISPWDVGGKIDDFGRYLYQRIDLSISEIPKDIGGMAR